MMGMVCRAPIILCVLAACRFGFDVRGAEIDAPATSDGSAQSDVIELPPGAPAAMSELCMSTRLTVIRGGSAADDSMATNVAQQLAASCAQPPATRTVSQDDAGILEPTSNRPLLAVDDLGVMGGGDLSQRALTYLLINDTPITVSETAARLRLYQRSNGMLLLDQAKSGLNMSHDVAMIMLTYEPIGSASVLSLTGATGQGTLAAGYWFTNELVPTISTATQRWYVLDWVDGNSDMTPNAPDTYTVVAMGP
jgi:hypothetical protein